MQESDASRERSKRVLNMVPWWKRTYLVNRDFQMRFARHGVVVGILSSAMSTAIILWTFWNFNIWQGQRLPLPIMVAIFALIAINVIGIWVSTVLATHKVAGPMFNLIRQFQRLSNADFCAAARFRESDEMHYVARRFNDMSVKLRIRNEFLFAKLAEISDAVEKSDIETAKEHLRILREMHARENGNSSI